MNCPSPSTCALFADGALEPDTAAEIERHVRSCVACEARLAALAAEGRALRAALQLEDPVLVAPFEHDLGVRHLLAAAAAAATIGWLASAFWGALDAAVPAGVRWLSPLDVRVLLDVAISVVVLLAREGSDMLTSIRNLAVSGLLIALLAWGTVGLVRRNAGAAVLLSLALIVFVLPSLGHALEIRRGDVVNVPAGETIDDTLIVMGKAVSINGTVNGDLLALAERVTLDGNVTGNVIAAAATVDLSGTVGGSVFGAGQSVELEQVRVARNLYAGGRGVTIASGGDVAGNAIAFASNVDVGGRIGIDLRSFARDLSIDGNVERHVEAYGSTVTVVAPGRVGGNLTAHVPEAERVAIVDGATVAGTVDTQIAEGRFSPRNKYLNAGFYVWQAIRLGAAFVTGLLLLWLLPGLRTFPLRDGLEALKMTGIGLATAVTLPVLCIIACITVVGAPLGVIGFILGAIALYFAKTVVAQFIGRTLFKSTHGVPHHAATLLAGLVIVLVAINLPMIGWFLNLVLTLLGLGMLLLFLLGMTRRWEAD